MRKEKYEQKTGKRKTDDRRRKTRGEEGGRKERRKKRKYKEGRGIEKEGMRKLRGGGERGAEKIGQNKARGMNDMETVKTWKEKVPEMKEEKRKSRKSLGKLEKRAERVCEGEEKARERKEEKKREEQPDSSRALLACWRPIRDEVRETRADRTTLRGRVPRASIDARTWLSLRCTPANASVALLLRPRPVEDVCDGGDPFAQAVRPVQQWRQTRRITETGRGKRRSSRVARPQWATRVAKNDKREKELIGKRRNENIVDPRIHISRATVKDCFNHECEK